MCVWLLNLCLLFVFVKEHIKCPDNRAMLFSAFSTTLRIVPGRGEAVIKYLLTPLINDIKMFQKVFLEERRVLYLFLMIKK